MACYHVLNEFQENFWKCFISLSFLRQQALLLWAIDLLGFVNVELRER